MYESSNLMIEMFSDWIYQMNNKQSFIGVIKLISTTKVKLCHKRIDNDDKRVNFVQDIINSVTYKTKNNGFGCN